MDCISNGYRTFFVVALGQKVRALLHWKTTSVLRRIANVAAFVARKTDTSLQMTYGKGIYAAYVK